MHNNYLVHHGILGQKWGIRRFQNKDGSLKPAGEKRYYDGEKSNTSPTKKYSKGSERKGLSDRQKKAIKIGAIAVGTALTAYGAYKLNKFIRGKNAEIRMQQGLKACNEYLKNNPFKALDNSSRSINIENGYKKYTIDQFKEGARYKAKKDSFSTAVKNVYDDHKRNPVKNKSVDYINVAKTEIKKTEFNSTPINKINTSYNYDDLFKSNKDLLNSSIDSLLDGLPTNKKR